MLFVVRSVLIAMLVTLVGLTFNAALDTRCPSPRFSMIGNSPNGRTLVIFDACLGLGYATPVIGLEPVQKQKGWNING